MIHVPICVRKQNTFQCFSIEKVVFETEEIVTDGAVRHLLQIQTILNLQTHDAIYLYSHDKNHAPVLQIVSN